MKKFEPSRDFVSRVMRDIHAYEKTQIGSTSIFASLVSFRTMRLAMSAGGLLLGIANLIRLYLSVFSPVLCR